MDAFKRAARRHLSDFIVIVLLFVLSLGVASYILSHQRFNAPGWVPIIGHEFYRVDAAFQTAQSVMPGQGQTVNIAGVPVGEIGHVELKNGQAVIEMKIKPKYAPIYRDARLQLRARTPLNDMFVALEPGHPKAGKVPEGGLIPISQTKPNVNFDEILASFDGETRDYLQLFLTGASQGLKGRGKDFARLLRRSEPTQRDGRKIVHLLQRRSANIRRGIYNFARVAKELGANNQEIAAWIDSANAMFGAFAQEEASIKQVIQKTPGAFGETADAVKEANKVAIDLAPALRDLKPSATELGPALKKLKPFFEQTTPIIRDQIRPAVRASQPLLAELRPASRDLDRLGPEFLGATKTLNRLLNEVAFNPKGDEEGYFFWLNWFSHLNQSIFSTGDANGPIRSGVTMLNCKPAKGASTDVSLFQSIARDNANPPLRLLSQLLKFPTSC